ncbi:TauD/TfdA family dioxygenase [Streptomyces sp. NPDC006288]|uniref:TauD/TfdA dioxygenase family protein n=1 Tax=Streptomyces sp. NPDC006288 TaxID=3156743 RepID=UPI0033AD1195
MRAGRAAEFGPPDATVALYEYTTLPAHGCASTRSTPRRPAGRILDMVHRLAWRTEFRCWFRWEKGDIAIWDNLATQHYAVSDYAPHVRTTERITLEGVPIK